MKIEFVKYTKKILILKLVGLGFIDTRLNSIYRSVRSINKHIENIITISYSIMFKISGVICYIRESSSNKDKLNCN